MTRHGEYCAGWSNNQQHIIAIAGLLQANHRGTEDCRASQSDPTDSDAPGNPARKPATANSSNNNNTVGGPYHPPLWHCHGRGRRRASTAGIARAGLLQANHWGTEDCRASQGDPTDSDAPGNPTRRPAASGEAPATQQQQSQHQQQHQQGQPEQQEEQQQQKNNDKNNRNKKTRTTTTPTTTTTTTTLDNDHLEQQRQEQQQKQHLASRKHGTNSRNSRNSRNITQ